MHMRPKNGGHRGLRLFAMNDDDDTGDDDDDYTGDNDNNDDDDTGNKDAKIAFVPTDGLQCPCNQPFNLNWPLCHTCGP